MRTGQLPLLLMAAGLSCGTNAPQGPLVQVGDDLVGTIEVVDGAPITIPDPGGQVLIFELIRSADW